MSILEEMVINALINNKPGKWVMMCRWAPRVKTVNWVGVGSPGEVAF